MEQQPYLSLWACKGVLGVKANKTPPELTLRFDFGQPKSTEEGGGLQREHFSGESKLELCTWGLKVPVRNCPRLPIIVVILQRKFRSHLWTKRSQMCTIAHDSAQTTESGIKPMSDGPDLDAANLSGSKRHHPLGRLRCDVRKPQENGHRN